MKRSTTAGGLGARELGDHAPVAEGLDGRQAAHLEAGRRGLVGLHVELGELDGALVGVDGLFDHRREHVAGLAPVRPEVHEHGHLGGALEHMLLEVGVGHLEGHGSI